nr:hypothetical protein [Tanacetum cinerariifolium]
MCQPPSPNYVPGPEHPPSPVEIPYVPEPEYPEYLAPSEDEAPIKDEPLPTDASPTALSLGFAADHDPIKDPKEDPEEDHADYHDDGWDGDDEPSDDDDDDDDTDDEEPFEDKDDGEEEEEHLALVSSSAIPVVDPVPLARDTEAFETDESAPTPRSPQTMIPFSQTRLCRAHKTVRPEPPMSASMEARIAEHAATPTPPLLVSSPSLPLPLPLTISPTDAGAPFGYRATGIRMRALLSPTSPRTDVPEAEMPPRKRACFTTPAFRLEIGESSARTEEFQVRFEEAQDDRAFLRARVNTLFTDRPFHRHIIMLLDRESTYARRAWAGSEDRSAAIEAYVRTLEAHVATLIAQTSSLQTQLTTIVGRIETLEPRDLEPQDEPAEAGSSFVYLTKMAPRKRTARKLPATSTTTTTPVTDAQLRALIARGVTAALAERDADMSKNVDDSNDSGTGGRRQVVASRSSSPTTSIPEIPTALILPAPSAIVAPSSEPCKALTARKSIRPLTSHHLALRYTSQHLDHFTSVSSSSHSSSDHSSYGHSTSGPSLSGHTPPDTTVVDSSTPPRFVHPPPARTLRCSEAYLRWRSAPLSTMYLPTASESSAEDSSFESSDGPSRKRCRSPAATRFRDSISPEDSVEEDIDTDVLDDIEGSRCVFPTFPIVFRPFKTLCFFNYALILRQDYDITSSLRRGALQQVSTVRECTFTDFLKCQTMNFKGTERVVSLTQWVVGHDVAYAMP